MTDDPLTFTEVLLLLIIAMLFGMMLILIFIEVNTR